MCLNCLVVQLAVVLYSWGGSEQVVLAFGIGRVGGAAEGRKDNGEF
jgi:hypothetical protein